VLVHLDTDIGGDPDDVCALAMLLGWPDWRSSASRRLTRRPSARLRHEVLRLAGHPDARRSRTPITTLVQPGGTPMIIALLGPLDRSGAAPRAAFDPMAASIGAAPP
jgi:hypothetical protein